MNTFMLPAQKPSMVLTPVPFGGPPDGDLSDSSSPLRRLGNILRRRWLLILVCAVLSTILVGLIGFSLPPVYTARAQVVIAPPSPPAGAPAVARPDETALTIETEVSAIGSRDQMNRILDRLTMTPGFPIASFAQEGRLRQLARSLAARIERGPFGGWIDAILSPAEAAEFRAFIELPKPSQHRELMVDELERNLKVNSEPRSRVISVRYTAQNATLAALIANTAVDAYLSGQTERKGDDIRRELARLDKQLPEQRNAMEAANAALRAFRLDHAVLDAANTEQQEQQAVVLKSKIKASQSALSTTSAEVAALRALRVAPRADIVETRFSTVLTGLQKQERSLIAAQGNEAVAPPSAALAAIRRQIAAEADLAIGRLTDESALLNERIKAFERQFDIVQANLRDMQPAADQLRQLVRLADVQRQIYEDGLLTQQRLIRSQDLITPDAAIMSAAAPPQKPASTHPILFLPPALALGLLIGGLAAIWRESQDNTLRNERTVYGALGVPCAGFLPPSGSRPISAARSRREEAASDLYSAALRSVFVATLCVEAARHGRKIVLVTSSVAGEESSGLAASFALYAARLLPRVLLIDLNARDPVERPGALMPYRPGGALAGSETDKPVPGMVLTHPVPDVALDVLSVRRRQQDPVAFLIGGDLPESLKRLRGEYDCIIIHAGPVLETAEAQLLAGEADRILFAIRWGCTRRPLVENALAVLGGIDGSSFKPGSVSAVLTEVNVRRHLAYRFGDAIEAMARSYRRRSSS